MVEKSDVKFEESGGCDEFAYRKPQRCGAIDFSFGIGIDTDFGICSRTAQVRI